jgi:hypothetical protein
MYISYAQLGAVHQAAGELEISARRRGEKLHAGLFRGSVKSTDLRRAPEGDDLIVVFTRYEAPDVVRRYSYFGNPVRIEDYDLFTVVAETQVDA